MKEKEPKIASFRNATTIYMGHANGQDGEWDLFYSVHFEDRSAERKCSVEKAGIILGTIFEDAIFADKVSEDIVLSRASRRQSYDYVEKRQRFQILDMVNKVSFILELYPRTKEIYAITVLTQDREAINKKRNTVVIKILPAVEREDVVESKVVYYELRLAHPGIQETVRAGYGCVLPALRRLSCHSRKNHTTRHINRAA